MYKIEFCLNFYTDVRNNNLTKKYGRMRQLTSSDNLDNITDNGIYWYPTESVSQNAPYQNAAVVEVIGSTSATGEKFQRVTRYGVPGKSSWRPLGGGSNGWLAWAESFTNADIQSGTTLVNLIANGITEFSVTFPRTFASPPSVCVSAVTSRPDLRCASVASRTASGFTGEVYNDFEKGSFAVFWIAIAR